jgi:hypothetical protein
MKDEGKRISKIAYCHICGGYTIASLISAIDHQTESDFEEALQAGFSIKLETITETKAREFVSFNECSFNSVQWERIYSFLTFLTEQPLTINMSDYGDNIHEHPEIVIYCNGVIFY